jgi:hypothetical protein
MKISFSAVRRALIISLSFLAVAGCASPSLNPSAIKKVEVSKLGDGVWRGKLAVTGSNSDGSGIGKDGLPISFDSVYLVVVCDGKATFWYQNADGGFRAPGRFEDFKIHSNHGIHMIYAQHHDLEDPSAPSWFETQVVLLVELAEGGLRAEMSRAVVNPGLPEPDPFRNFVRRGNGTLDRV